MQEYLYKIQLVRPEMLIEGPNPEEEELIGQHFQYLKFLTSDGVVILAGRTTNTDPSSFGIVIFKAENEELAKEIMNNDPEVEQGVFKAELFPYSVALKEI